LTIDILTMVYSPDRFKGPSISVRMDIWFPGISLIKLPIAEFPFSENWALDDSDLGDLLGNLFSSNPMFTARMGQKRVRSIGVSLQGGVRMVSWCQGWSQR